MEIEKNKIDSATVKFFDDYIKEDISIFQNILGKIIQNVQDNQLKN